MVTRWDVTSLGYIWLFNDIIILVRCSKLIPTCLVTRGLTSAPTKKQIYKSILIHSPSYPAIGAIRRRAAWSFSTASAFAINKAKAHDYLAWSYIIYTSTARYCWTHPHTVATEQAARLLATVSSWKQLNLWQLPHSSLTNKEKGLGLAFTRGWSESGPRHIYGLLAEPWMRHLTKDTTQNSAILHPAWYNLTGSASPCPTLLDHWAQDKTKLS